LFRGKFLGIEWKYREPKTGKEYELGEEVYQFAGNTDPSVVKRLGVWPN